MAAPALPQSTLTFKHVLVRQELDRPLFTQRGIEQRSTALSGRRLPQRSVAAGALASEDAADALTEHQAVILDAIRLLNRGEIRGGADSGKTFLAVEQARRLSAKGPGLLRPCPRLQGARTPLRRTCRQRGVRVRTLPRTPLRWPVPWPRSTGGAWRPGLHPRSRRPDLARRLNLPST